MLFGFIDFYIDFSLFGFFMFYYLFEWWQKYVRHISQDEQSEVGSRKDQYMTKKNKNGPILYLGVQSLRAFESFRSERYETKKQPIYVVGD